jgi:hypothetical protein
MAGDTRVSLSRSFVDVEADDRGTDAVAVRSATFAHEAGLRSVGLACLVFGVVLVALGGLSLAAAVKNRSVIGSTGFHVLLAYVAVWLGFGVLALAGAWGYFRLEPWVRWLSVPIALGAMATSIGLATPMVAYAAWLTWSRTGRTLLSPGYVPVLARAPGWPRWWQWGHVLGIVVIVGLYVFAFYAATQVSMED